MKRILTAALALALVVLAGCSSQQTAGTERTPEELTHGGVQPGDLSGERG